ncbi:MAG TPA: hypothetical protein VFB66_04905 [Tepidisphaeraceae bacterium]|nr:hypothetical protein [Tepidisphaeraceae bacterium]
MTSPSRDVKVNWLRITPLATLAPPPRVAPTGLDRSTKNVSLLSKTLSSMTSTGMVLVVSPGRNVSRPASGRKSAGPCAAALPSWAVKPRVA